MPLVSIIIPVYNVEDVLERCVDSVLRQSVKDIEIILVDDGSPDGCPLICDRYVEADSRVLVFHKPNGGLSDARNYGLDIAIGDYVMFIDSDDYIEEESCERLLNAAKKTGADIALGDWQVNPGPDKPDHYSALEEDRAYPTKTFILDAVKAGEWYPCACFMFCKRSLFDDNGLRFAVGLLHEDMEMQPRVFLAARSVACLKYKFYHYIHRPGSIMKSSNSEKRASSMKEILGRWKAQFDDVSDVELRTTLYAYLSKCFLHTCRELRLKEGLNVPGIGKAFLIKTGANPKEKIKACVYAISPLIYSRL